MTLLEFITDMKESDEIEIVLYNVDYNGATFVKSCPLGTSGFTKEGLNEFEIFLSGRVFMMQNNVVTITVKDHNNFINEPDNIFIKFDYFLLACSGNISAIKYDFWFKE